MIEAHAIAIEVLCVYETEEKTLRKQYKAENELEVRRIKTVVTVQHCYVKKRFFFFFDKLIFICEG